MKNYEIKILYGALQELSTSSIVFPAAINYARKCNIKLLQPYIEELSQAQDEALIKYGVSEDGRTYNIPEENREAYSNEIGTLFSTDIDINLVKFPMKCLESLELTSQQYDTLFEFAEE